MFIGHIFDYIDGDNVENSVQSRICKAEDKLREVMTRNHWIGNDFHYRFGLDIGSSPGGWTNFLIKGVNIDKVISVDKGFYLLL